MRVLIADDHAGFRLAIRQIFKSHGNLQICGEASNGQDAIQQALELRPDLILMDISMPVMDGLTAVTQIKAVLPDIPILMLSSFKEMDEASQQAGAQGFVLKTEVADDLLEIVDRLLRGQSFFGEYGTGTGPRS